MDMSYILVCIPILLATLSFLLMRKHKKSVEGGTKFPPGSMGWPCIGETFQFYSQNPNLFFASKQKRYGEIFKSHLLGCPCVILASPEAAKFVLVNQAHLFKPTYPKSKEQFIGPSALFFHQGDYHMRLRKLVLGSLTPKSIQNLIPLIESTAVASLDSWAGDQVVNTFQEMKKFSFDVGVLLIFGRLDAYYKEELKKNYHILDRGYNSFPTIVPGTSYNKAVLARKKLSKLLSEIVSERKERGVEDKDLLDGLMNAKEEEGDLLTHDQIADNVIGVLFAAQDTTASVLTWILKYLHDHPKLFEAVKAEQRAIYESNAVGKLPLTWAQTRNMPLTHKVILESLRMASIISFTFREAVVDVEYKGYLIPKGWKVLPLFRNIHYNAEFFKDPHRFDPQRFEGSPKPSTFLPFGSGVHACPGNELAKLEMFIVIHHLVTKFRWEVVGPEGATQYSPFPIPKNGLPVKVWKESNRQRQECA